MYYLKELLGLNQGGSKVSCWVDDNVGEARTIMNAANIGGSILACVLSFSLSNGCAHNNKLCNELAVSQ